MNNSDNKKFIYVFCERDKQVMIGLGYQMITQIPKDCIYVFVVDSGNTVKFSAPPDITYYYLSDTLTF